MRSVNPLLDRPNGTKRHQLKCWPSSFQALWDGTKTYEVRKNDRGYQVGDTLQIMEYDVGLNYYTGRMIGATVTYMTSGPDFGLPEGMCVMAVFVWARKNDGQ